MSEIYEKGQVVVPKHIRDMFGLVPGTKVNFKVENSQIMLVPAHNALEEFRRIRAKYAKYSDKEVQRMMKESEKKMHKEWLHVP